MKHYPEMIAVAIALAAMMLLAGCAPTRAQGTDEISPDVEAASERFELWSECAPVWLVVESLSSDARGIGLTKERIQPIVESRLRGGRIYGDNEYESLGSYLYVNVGVVGNSFSIGLSFRQHVSTMKDILDAFRVAIRSEMEKDEFPAESITEFVSDSLVTKRMRQGETRDQAVARIWVEDSREFQFMMAVFLQSATTWEIGSLGTHGGDAGFILQGVAEATDTFVNEYLRVNAEACD